MLPNFAGDSLLMVVILVFIAVMLMIEGFYLLWQRYQGTRARKLEERLRNFGAIPARSPQARLVKRSVLSDLPAVRRLLSGVPRVEGLERHIGQAGLDWTVSGLALGCIVAGMGAALVASKLGYLGWTGNGMVGLVAACIPVAYVEWCRQSRFRQIEHQLPDALDMLCRALRSGHAFSSALHMVAEEMADPVAGEFRLVRDEVNFGVSLHQALTNLTVRVPSVDLRYFTVAVLIQREAGGNLTEILANLAALIRERHRLRGKIKVLSAEGRLSAWVLGAMPFGLGGVMYMMNPAFMSPLWTDPMGQVIIKATLTMMAIGIVILIKIVKIRV